MIVQLQSISGGGENVQCSIFVLDHVYASPQETPSVRIWLGADVCDRLVDFALSVADFEEQVLPSLTTVDGIGLLVRNLNAEFFLNCHHNLHGIQAVQPEVILEV